MSMTASGQWHRRERRCLPPAAFTLIELLVVVAIIALLLAILTPSLARAKYLTRRVMCQSNMRQQHTAQFNYTSQNRGLFPYRNENSPDYQRQGGAAGSCVSLMRGRYVATSIMVCPLCAMMPVTYAYYTTNNWATGAYGGWDTECAYVYTAYMWMGGFGPGASVAMIDSEPAPPATIRECNEAVTFITHRLNYYNSVDLHEVAHGGRGLFQTGVPYDTYVPREMPVLYGDGHSVLHMNAEIKPRMTLNGNYPSTPGWPGTYLW